MEDEDHHDHDHHDHDDIHVQTLNANRSSGGPPATPRWNPTKEQINMLEGLYRQGIRTPSAEQIQQITTRLRAFGHIEGKNVFYWFQNHKARQRQKQKQESLAYLNRYLHRSSPTTHSIFPSTTSHHIPCPNVVCGPYYVPTQTDHGNPIGTFHQPQQSKMLAVQNATRVSSTVSRSSTRSQKFSQRTSMLLSSAPGSGFDRLAVDFGGSSGCRTKTMSTRALCYNNIKNSANNHETLSLFPLSPTGGFKRKVDREELNHDYHDQYKGQDNDAENNISTSITTSDCEVEDRCSVAEFGGGCDQPFYDFFSR